MANASVATDLHQTADVAVDFAAKVAFHLIIAIDNLAKTGDVGFRQILNLRARVDTGLLH